MNTLDNYLKQIQNTIDRPEDDIYDHPVEFPNPSFPDDETNNCQPGMKWCKMKQKCIPENEHHKGDKNAQANNECNKKI